MPWLVIVVGWGIGFSVLLASAAGLVQAIRYRKAFRRFRATGRCDHRYTRVAPTPFPDVTPAGVWCRICGRPIREI